MKKHLSVFMLMARSNIYKWCISFVLVAVVESVMFYLTFQREVYGGNDFNLEYLIAESKIAWVFAIWIILVIGLLGMTGREIGSRTGYTLRRLSISAKGVLVWQSIYNVISLFILWAMQLCLVMAFCVMYMKNVNPELVSGQTIFLACYRSGFMHMLLPLQDILQWVGNVVFILGAGILMAYLPYQQWGKEAVHEN